MGLMVLVKPLAKFIEFVRSLAKRPQKSLGATTEPAHAVRNYRLRGDRIPDAAKKRNATLTVALKCALPVPIDNQALRFLDTARNVFPIKLRPRDRLNVGASPVDV